MLTLDENNGYLFSQKKAAQLKILHCNSGMQFACCNSLHFAWIKTKSYEVPALHKLQIIYKI